MHRIASAYECINKRKYSFLTIRPCGKDSQMHHAIVIEEIIELTFNISTPLVYFFGLGSSVKFHLDSFGCDNNYVHMSQQT